MQNKHIVEDLAGDGIGRRVEIYADCAEPKSIADIRDAGFNVIACDKDAPVKSDKLKFQLQWMQGWKLFVTKDSLNLINELRNYTWAKDKDGNLLNQPIDKFNHLLDALRYAVWSKYGRNAGQGQYYVRIR
jgi:phage terminase large subunit